MVVDTSALLALYFREAHGEWVADQMNAYTGLLRMSTVNLAETLIRLEDRQPKKFGALRDALLDSGIEMIPPDINQARMAAEARLRLSLNLGDCFAYALALANDWPLLTLDADFRRADIEVLMPE